MCMLFSLQQQALLFCQAAMSQGCYLPKPLLFNPFFLLFLVYHTSSLFDVEEWLRAEGIDLVKQRTFPLGHMHHVM